MSETFLIIGGNGFVGYHVLKELVHEGKMIRCIDRVFPEQENRFSTVDYRIGDVWNKAFLQEVLSGVDIVLDFVSTTLPNTNELSLEHEINVSLPYYDYLLSTMIQCGVKKYIFPSSGGAIYGNRQTGRARETDVLSPSTPYGVGKKIVEDIIHYYNQRCGLSAAILRIGNVYGSMRFRDRPQGVVDVFIQNALKGEPIAIWGNADSVVRDYIYLEDVAHAVLQIIHKGIEDVNIYNIGTGIGTSVGRIVELIEKNMGHEIKKEYKVSEPCGVNQIILSIEKIQSETNWSPQVTLDEGIKQTIEFKKLLLL